MRTILRVAVVASVLALLLAPRVRAEAGWKWNPFAKSKSSARTVEHRTQLMDGAPLVSSPSGAARGGTNAISKVGTKTKSVFASAMATLRMKKKDAPQQSTRGHSPPWSRSSTRKSKDQDDSTGWFSDWFKARDAAPVPKTPQEFMSLKRPDYFE